MSSCGRVGANGRDLAEIRERWRDETIDYIGRAMVEEITKQFRIEAELWDAWEKSKGVKRKVVHKCEDTGNGTKETHTVEKVESFGDPRYIELIQKCCEKRHRLLGLDDATGFGSCWRNSQVAW